MTPLQCTWDFLRKRPLYLYLIGGITIGMYRETKVNAFYKENFMHHEVARYKEYLTFLKKQGQKPQEQ